MDSTFEFEKRRNTPVRYNRDLVVKTIQAMKQVDKIKQVRKERFHKMRLAASRNMRKSMVEKELERHRTLLEGPTVPARRNVEMTDALNEGVQAKAPQKKKVMSLAKQKLRQRDEDMEGGQGGGFDEDGDVAMA